MSRRSCTRQNQPRRGRGRRRSCSVWRGQGCTGNPATGADAAFKAGRGQRREMSPSVRQAPSCSSSAAGHGSPRLCRGDRHARIVRPAGFFRRMVGLEIEAAGNARCAAGSDVCACAFSNPAGKFLVDAAGQGKPCLIIRGRGFDGDKGHGGQLVGLKIVQLQQSDFGAVRPDDDIALALRGISPASPVTCAQARQGTGCAGTIPFRRCCWSM